MIVLRLQGLHSDAGSEDIRKFFHGLDIPQGCVHIIGGELGEAFILFKSEGDGQLAMRRSGSTLRGSAVTLHISNVAELKEKLVSCLARSPKTKSDNRSSGTQQICSPTKSSPEKVATGQHKDKTPPPRPPCPSAVPVKKKREKKPKRQSDAIQRESSTTPPPTLEVTQIQYSPAAVHLPSEKVLNEQLKSETVACCGYLCLYGFPQSVTKAHVSQFLCGLTVQEVIVNACLGYRNGCLVKVANERDVEAGLQRDGQSFGAFTVQVRKSSLGQWTHATRRSRGPPEQSEMVSSTSETMTTEQEGKRPKKRRYSWDAPPPDPGDKKTAACEEYYLMVRNLNPNLNKTKIKALLGCPHLQNSGIQHLLDKSGERTSTTFVTFDQVEDYVNAMNLSGTRFGSMVLEVSPITREKMLSQLRSWK
ncbi:RNA binding motif protein 12Ba [Engraulis encrasicolus]|uniref:RNA binding motif protein 12Ba n=1 Tax=Engraulis encrasicolus TaxID=184585 RepID=UPI002FD776A9